jgi:SAM-dependent methyltransferase
MFKELFVEHLEEVLPKGPARVLEVGSGTSQPIVDFLKRRTDVSYRGVEPSERAHAHARELLKSYPNAELVNGFGYDLGEANAWDLCFSLSVLEHVKQLEKFLAESVRVVKQNGWIVHRWDLGHSLTPSSSKERFQVMLGNRFPKMLSEHKFVSHLHMETVVALLQKHGADTKRVTFHQMPEHKALLKQLKDDTQEKSELIRELVEWEFKISPFVGELPQKSRERLFPAIAVWAQKL